MCTMVGGPRHVPQLPETVAEAFARFPAEARAALLTLRALIFDEAQRLGVGPIAETLKWGEPAYLTEASRSGTTIRLGCHRDAPNCYAAFFHCQTTMVSDIREQLGDAFTYHGTRAVCAPAGQAVDAAAWRVCFAMALLYKRR
jgi:hypothetical protein